MNVDLNDMGPSDFIDLLERGQNPSCRRVRILWSYNKECFPGRTRLTFHLWFPPGLDFILYPVLLFFVFVPTAHHIYFLVLQILGYSFLASLHYYVFN